MLKEFITYEEFINSELGYMKLQKLFLTEEECETVKNLVAALEVVEIASRKLCGRIVTLAIADTIFEKLLEKLYKQTSPLSRQLYHNVEYRINERRDKTLSTLQAFLENNEFFEELEQDDVKMLEYADRKEIFELAGELYKRLFLDSNDGEAEVVDLATEGKLILD